MSNRKLEKLELLSTQEGGNKEDWLRLNNPLPCEAGLAPPKPVSKTSLLSQLGNPKRERWDILIKKELAISALLSTYEGGNKEDWLRPNNPWPQEAGLAPLKPGLTSSLLQLGKPRGRDGMR